MEPDTPKIVKRRFSEVDDDGAATTTTQKEVKLGPAFQYLDIFNAMAVESSLLGDNDLFATQIGSVWWTPREKIAFFQGLCLKGRDDLQAISQAIGTKSVVEIVDFLQLLQRGLEEVARYQPSLMMLQEEIPAAVEVNEDLENGLQECADELAERQEVSEQKILREMYGELWLLDLETINAIESGTIQIQDNLTISDAMKEDTIAALEFFKLKKFLRLSRSVFMNSKTPELNYREHTEDDQEPSIRLPAITDMYRIVKMLLERLLMAAHHCALSNPPRVYNPRYGIGRREVSAAAQILGLSKDDPKEARRKYWMSVPQRCQVEVCCSTQDGILENLSFDEVEAQLSMYDKTPAESRGSVVQVTAQNSHTAADAKDARPLLGTQLDKRRQPHHADDIESTEASNNSESNDESDDDLAKNTGEVCRDEAEDLQLEELDKMVAENELRYLRGVCEGFDRRPKRSEESTLKSKRAGAHNYSMGRLDWRQSISYKSEWERYTKPLKPAEYFSSDIDRTKDTDFQMYVNEAQEGRRTIEYQESMNERTSTGSDRPPSNSIEYEESESDEGTQVSNNSEPIDRGQTEEHNVSGDSISADETGRDESDDDQGSSNDEDNHDR